MIFKKGHQNTLHKRAEEAIKLTLRIRKQVTSYDMVGELSQTFLHFLFEQYHYTKIALDEVEAEIESHPESEMLHELKYELERLGLKIQVVVWRAIN